MCPGKVRINNILILHFADLFDLKSMPLLKTSHQRITL